MKKTINIVEDLHKGIDLNELAKMPQKPQADKQAAKEDDKRDEHQGHGE